jgi:hypothetical protein
MPVRECPVPKPNGLIGKILGFQEDEARKDMAKPIIKVESIRQRPFPQEEALPEKAQVTTKEKDNASER